MFPNVRGIHKGLIMMARVIEESLKTTLISPLMGEILFPPRDMNYHEEKGICHNPDTALRTSHGLHCDG